MLRIVAGTARGRRIEVPDGAAVRPTGDRVREAMFNSLNSLGAVADTRVLDLFAGSGGLGMEALSRGAAHVAFVEHDPRALDALRGNLERLGFAGQAELVPGDCLEYLRRLNTAAARFDLILCDPPYRFDGWQRLLELCIPHRSDDAIAVIESDRQIELPAGWRTQRSRRYGATVLAFAVAPEVGSR